MKRIINYVGALLCAGALTGCNQNAEAMGNSFGNFGHNGVFLTEYATKQITVDEAKQLVDIIPASLTRRSLNDTEREINNDNIHTVLAKYAFLTTTVKYYISDREEQQVRQDIYQGTDFKYLLENNHYEPFGQMSVKYLFVDDVLLDDMERQNAEYVATDSHLTTPFNEPYTYHTNEENKLIVQTHSFAELPASTCGGIGSTFRQDCELIFDEEGKIMFWQSSLGLYTSTPTGTVKEGYVFEVSFDWTSK